MIIKLMLGVRQFQKKSFFKYQNLFQELRRGQNPDTLFITCSDSRIDQNLITDALPGELFAIRNIGNIIPKYPAQTSEAAAIEYPLSTLKIKDIIVCGHTQCGAMKGLLNPDLAKDLPATASWLKHSHEVLNKMHDDKTDMITDYEQKLIVATQYNIKAQIDHLKTYPIIAEKVARNELTLHGWLYEFETGKISVYEPNSDKFVSLEEAVSLAVEVRKNKIVTLVAMTYLEGLANPQTAKDYQSAKQLLTKLQDNIEVIWNNIKQTAQLKLWEEIGGLYESQEDKNFLKILDSGSRVKLPDLKKFEQLLNSSKGAQEYNKNTFQPSFFSRDQGLTGGSNVSVLGQSMP